MVDVHQCEDGRRETGRRGVERCAGAVEFRGDDLGGWESGEPDFEADFGGELGEARERRYCLGNRRL